MKSLSIVFQGPASGPDGMLCTWVLRHLERTRRAFPETEIILSTWLAPAAQTRLWQRHLHSLDVHLVVSDDPGPIIGTDNGAQYITNVNRLLTSSRAGLAAVSRPLAVKLRTDTWLSDRKLLSLFRLHVLCEAPSVPRHPDFIVFQSRVINATWFARDARGSLPYLYHPGDILLAGYTADLRLFFSAPLAGQSIFQPVEMPGLGCPWRYVPEQWFWVHAIRQATGQWVYPGNFSCSEENTVDSEQWYLANFVPYSARALSLHWPKYWRYYPFRGLFSVYTHRRWLRLAARYQGRPAFCLSALFSDFFTAVWRNGYRLRTCLLRHALLRRIALRLFVHRRL